MITDVTKFCFCSMFETIMNDNDSKFVATTTIDNCKVKFYNNKGIVHVIYLNESGYEILETGNFFDMYCTSDNLVFTDLVVAKFDIVDMRKKEDKMGSEWIPCDYIKACREYDSGGMVRIESSIGVVEHFSKTGCEGKPAYIVINHKVEDWEYRV